MSKYIPTVTILSRSTVDNKTYVNKEDFWEIKWTLRTRNGEDVALETIYCEDLINNNDSLSDTEKSAALVELITKH